MHVSTQCEQPVYFEGFSRSCDILFFFPNKQEFLGEPPFGGVDLHTTQSSERWPLLNVLCVYDII